MGALIREGITFSEGYLLHLELSMISCVTYLLRIIVI